MSNALLNGELFAEVKELDQRYGNQSVEAKKPKKLKKYKPHPQVERLAQLLKSSNEDTKVKQAKVVEKNVKKLLKSKQSTPKYESIIQQLDSTKRHFEPKGRKLLKKKQKVAARKETSAFTDEDFEKFSQEYFVNSKPLKKADSDALD